MNEQGLTKRTVADNHPRDTRPDLKKTHVIVGVQVRDGNRVHGWKEYVSRDLWYGSMVDRREIVAEVTDKLITAMEEDK